MRLALSIILAIPALAWSAGFDDAMLAFENHDFAKAKAMIEPAARSGDAASMTLMGRILDEGMAQPATAVNWYRQAAEKGFAEAQVQLAELYDAGEGVPQDIEIAVIWYEKAAAQGNEDALVALGQHYSVDLNHKKSAVTYYLRAAALGNDTAQYQLGLIYLGEKGIPRDDIKAWMYFSLSADHIPEAAQARDVLELNMSPESLQAARKALADWEASH
ncbi:tetratricopeptide repeat protein [Fluviicoccus keumensis]|uniref:tetratricopeptide repeat protein n=1 Tax=Fluviicoccus keumensis TaxID=1435465 RepID=UPI0013EED9C8|nr:tetratricopeptide repeat protein [Fluviicoccus keumensis]